MTRKSPSIPDYDASWKSVGPYRFMRIGLVCRHFAPWWNKYPARHPILLRRAHDLRPVFPNPQRILPRLVREILPHLPRDAFGTRKRMMILYSNFRTKVSRGVKFETASQTPWQFFKDSFMDAKKLSVHCWWRWSSYSTKRGKILVLCRYCRKNAPPPGSCVESLQSITT